MKIFNFFNKNLFFQCSSRSFLKKINLYQFSNLQNNKLVLGFSSPKDYIKECTQTFEVFNFHIIKYLLISFVFSKNLMEKLENIDNLPNLDINYSEGVLVVTLNQKTFVMNRQLPNQQIWYSSPIRLEK